MAQNTLSSGRRWLWAQGSERFSVSGTQDLLNMCEACHFTDILFLAHNSSQGALWNSTMFNSSSIRLGGKPYLDYLVSEAAARGINVHAWLCVHSWPWMYGMLKSGQPNWKWSKANCADLSRTDVQQTVGQAAADACQNISGLAGVHLDYIRVPDGMRDQGITDDHVTACVAAARQATQAAGLELTIAGVHIQDPGTSRHDTYWCCQPWPSWLQDGLIDYSLLMLYFNVADTRQQLDDHMAQQPEVVQTRTYMGCTPQTWRGWMADVEGLDEWAGVLDLCMEHGYELAIFDDTWLRSEYQPALQQRPTVEVPVTEVPPEDVTEALQEVATQLAEHAQELGAFVASLDTVVASLNEVAASLGRVRPGRRTTTLLPTAGREDEG